MKLDVYGRFRLEVARENDCWVAYRLGPGKRLHDPTLVIPASLQPAEVPVYIDDLYHEISGPGEVVRIVS